MIRVPLIVSIILTGIFLTEAQCRDALRYVLENANQAGFVQASARLCLLLGTAVLGALALWFWARQSLRLLAGDETQAAGLGLYLPRVLAVVPLVAPSLTLLRLGFDDPQMQPKRWVLAGAFLLTGVAVYASLHLRHRFKRLAFVSTDRAYRWMAWGGAGLAGAVFVFSLSVREYATWFTPVGVLWLGAAFWVTLLSPLAIHGTRHGVPWLLLLAGLGTGLSLTNCTDNHQIRHERVKEKHLTETDPVARTSVIDGFRAWLRDHPGDEPIVFVAAEGGGIYAAYHSAYLLARLQAESGGAFGRQTFMISGVSGGAVGSGLFVNLLAAERTVPADGLRVDHAAATRSVLEADLLSPLLIAAVGPDAVQRFLPVSIPWFDRARALEDAMAHRWRQAEAAWAEPDGPRIDWSPSGSIWDLWLTPDKQGIRTDLPALFINTTVVERGVAAIIGPYGVPVQGRTPPPALQHLWAGARGLRIPIPTALALSARFPYVTPPGGLERIQLRPVDMMLPPVPLSGRDWRFADGGYYDNTGIETVLAVLQVLAEATGDDGRSLLPMERVRVLVIGARNEPVSPNNEGLADLLTPVRTLLRVRENRGDLARISLLARIAQHQYCESTLSTRTTSRLAARPGGRPVVEPDIPLGWMLSANSAARIRQHVDRNVSRLQSEILQAQAAPRLLPPAVRLMRD